MEAILDIVNEIKLSVILIFIIAFLTAYYFYSTWKYDYWKKQGVPGVTPWPFIGTLDILSMLKRQELSELKRHRKYGRVYGGYEGEFTVLHVIEPDLIKQVMVKDFPTFTNRRDFVSSSKDPIFGKMLSGMQGEEWKETRAILTPTFTTGKLKQMMYLIEDCAKELLKSFDQVAESKEPVDVKKYFTAFTLDVIASCAFGMKTNSLQNPNSEFVKNARIAFRSPGIRNVIIMLFPPLFWILMKVSGVFRENPFKYFATVARKMIDLRIEQKQETRKDFLDLLIEAEQQEENEGKEESADVNVAPSKRKILTRNTMVANSVIFLLAGHETTATTLTFFAYCLAMNPHVQDKLIQEIDDVMTECKGNLTYDIVTKLPYLDMAVSETLRLYPPALRIDRVCDAEYYKLQDIVLKKGTAIVTSTYALHHDEEFYPNPDVYDPERFTPENKAKRHQYTFMPFGVGPRNCIAMRFALTEIKLTMAYILSQYRFNTCEKTEFPLQYSPSFALLSPKSVTLQIQKRIDRPHFEN